MTSRDELKWWLSQCPLVAIIRGVTPAEVEAIGQAIHDAGIRIIEVPLNSPDPLESVKRLTIQFGDGALIGAGTVLEPGQVDQVREEGCRLIVSPNSHGPVIEATAAAGMRPSLFSSTHWRRSEWE